MTPGTPDDDSTDHMMECPVCGVVFDMRDVAKLFDHLHDGPEMPIMEMPPETKKPRHPEG